MRDLNFLKKNPGVAKKMYKEDVGKFFDKEDVPDQKSYMKYIKETLINDADQGDIAKRIRNIKRGEKMSNEKYTKVVNTSVREFHPEWLMGGDPGAIEAQEKRGQQQISNGIQLPKMIMDMEESPFYCPLSNYKIYDKLGVVVEGPTFGDELFLDVTLPEGWKIVPTEHSMWSNLMNDVDQTVAQIFYKASFHDRGAFLRLTDLGKKIIQNQGR